MFWWSRRLPLVTGINSLQAVTSSSWISGTRSGIAWVSCERTTPLWYGFSTTVGPRVYLIWICCVSMSSLAIGAGLEDRTYFINRFHIRKHIVGCFVNILYMFWIGSNNDPVKHVRDPEHSAWPLNFDVRCAPYCLETITRLAPSFIISLVFVRNRKVPRYERRGRSDDIEGICLSYVCNTEPQSKKRYAIVITLRVSPR